MSCVEQYMNGDKLETRPCTNTPAETLITTDDIHHNQLKDGPSLLQKAANFAASMAKHVASGMPIATQQQIRAMTALSFQMSRPVLSPPSLCSITRPEAGCPSGSKKGTSKLIVLGFDDGCAGLMDLVDWTL